MWSPVELRAFLDTTADHEHAILFRLAAMTGVRRGELAGLAWKSVDFDAARLTVRSTVVEVRAVGSVTGDVKTSRSRRSIDLDAATVAALRQHRSRQLERRLLIGAGWTDTGLVFVGVDGRPLLQSSLSQAFGRAVARSGLPRVRFHDLRHTHATHLLASGVNVKVVSERLGHASVSFTLDVFGHVMPDQQGVGRGGGGGTRRRSSVTNP